MLRSLWKCGPLTPPRLLAEVKLRREWSDSTIKTLLARLIRKHAVQSELIDGRLCYRPLISRDAWITGLIDDLVASAFEGDARQLESFLKRDFGSS